MAFSPTDLSNLYPWFAADTITGLNDGDGVTTWPDQSGLGKDLSQVTAGKKPLYKTGIQNGLPGVLLDGTDDLMTTANFATIMSQPTTIFAVAKAQANDTNQRHLFDGTGGGRNIVLDGGSGSPNWRAFTTSFITASGRDTTTNIFSALFNGASSKLRKNGVQIASGNTGAGVLSGLALGSSAGGAGGVGNYWNGYVFELILYNTDHTASFADVEQYLASKWGATIPGARPIRRRPPTRGLVYR